MPEQLYPQKTLDFELSNSNRRKKIAAFLAVYTFLLLGTAENDGFRLFPSKINIETRSYDRLTNPNNANVFILTEEFLQKGEAYKWSHRAGNTIQSIDEAVQKGADIIDIDINDVNGELYGEHGHVYMENILGADISLVIDPNEMEVSTNTPTKFEELIEHIAVLSAREGRQLAVFTEFKHGPFEDDTLTKMIDTLLKYQVPAIIQPGTLGDKLITIRSIYDVRKNSLNQGL